MAKLAIDRASIVFGEKSGDFHSKSGDREMFIILSKIGRSPEKSGDLEALQLYFREVVTACCVCSFVSSSFLVIFLRYRVHPLRVYDFSNCVARERWLEAHNSS